MTVHKHPHSPQQGQLWKRRRGRGGYVFVTEVDSNGRVWPWRSTSRRKQPIELHSFLKDYELHWDVEQVREWLPYVSRTIGYTEAGIARFLPRRPEGGQTND